MKKHRPVSREVEAETTHCCARMASDAVDAPDWDVSTAAEFDTALQTIILETLQNDLDIRGVWKYRHGQA